MRQRSMPVCPAAAVVLKRQASTSRQRKGAALQRTDPILSACVAAAPSQAVQNFTQPTGHDAAGTEQTLSTER
jgi:Fe-S-cluster-containing hydrogenase component 2